MTQLGFENETLNSEVNMQQQPGQIYCAILAHTLETVIYRLEDKRWHEPLMVRIFQYPTDQKGTSFSLEPLTICGFVEWLPVPSMNHILAVYQPANDVTKAYKNAVKKFRSQTQPQQKGMATATVVSPPAKTGTEQ